MSDLRWSCSSRSFPLVPFDLALRIISGMRFKAVDLCVSDTNRHLPLADVIADPEGAAKQLLSQVTARSLRVADVRIEAEALDRAGVSRVVAFASACRASVVSVVWSGEDEADVIAAIAGQAQPARLRVAMEPSGKSAPADVAEAAARHGAGLTLDYGAFAAAGASEEEVNALLTHVAHLRVRGVAPGAFQVAWAENVVNYSAIIRQLQAGGYGGYIAADYVWDPTLGRNRNDTIAETVQMRRALAQAS
jgi:sugar phosphate isomerase/epimerase